MDSEEHNEISELRRDGRPETTRGPYYHKAWWESYKGGVKGLLGGVIIGGAVGAIIGLGAAGALSLLGVSIANAGLVAAAGAAFGMWEGAQKFEHVGITAGAVSATQEISEVRMKEYVREKFRGLTNEIRELKAAIKGELSPSTLRSEVQPFDNSPVLKDEDFRTNHLDEHDDVSSRRFFYPNVMAVGTIIGLGAGAVLGFTPVGEEVLKLFVSGVSLEKAVAALPITTTAVGGLVGASFGISRDWFRSVFDVTDRLFLGLVRSPEKDVNTPSRTYDLRVPEPIKSPEPAFAAPSQRVLMSPSPDVTLTESPILSAHHFRDKLETAGKQALLGMDHTTAMRH